MLKDIEEWKKWKQAICCTGASENDINIDACSLGIIGKRPNMCTLYAYIAEELLLGNVCENFRNTHIL